jgi:autotransporter translocation and assembly factor TamB
MTKKRLGSLIAFVLLASVLLGGGIYLRNFISGQLRKKIQGIVTFSRSRFSVFPPSIFLEDVRTVSQTPSFSAKSVSIVLPFRSVLRAEKPLTVFVDQPVIKITAAPKGEQAKGKSDFSLPLPFAIEKGIVRGGAFSYVGAEESFEANDIQGSLQLKNRALSLRLEAGGSSLRLKPERQALEGRIALLLDAQGSRWSIDKFVLDGRDIWIKAQGTLAAQPDPRGTLRVSFKADMDSVAGILGIPFEWAGRIEGEGELTRTQEEIKFQSRLNSAKLDLNRVPLEKITGSVEYSTVHGILVEMDSAGRAGLGGIRVRQVRGRVEGDLRGFPLDPIVALGSLPWPVSSPAWGKFVLGDRQLVADFELRDRSVPGPQGTYPFSGPVHFTWDRKKEFQFSSPRLETSFGSFDFKGSYALDGAVSVTINGEVSDVRAARELTSRVLRRDLTFPEIRGSGIASVEISGTPKDVQVRIGFALSPAGFEKYDVAAAEGVVDIRKGTVNGQFRVDDPDFQGTINLLNSADGLEVKVKMTDGEFARAMAGLNLRLPLRGRGAGDFLVRMRQQAIRVEGEFSSPRLMFGSEDLRSVAGKLVWDGASISFPKLAFDILGGRVEGAWRMDVKSDQVEVDVSGAKFDLSSFRPDLTGELDFNLKGRGQMGEGYFASGKFGIKGLRFGPFPQVDGQGTLGLKMSRDRLGLTAQGHIFSEENDFSVTADIPLAADGMSIDVKGGFSDLDLIFPWRGVKGRLDFQAVVRGTPAAPKLNGVIEIKGPVLPFPQFPQALTDYSGRANVEGGRFSIPSFNGKLGGGEVSGSGAVSLEKGGRVAIDFSVAGKGMLLSPLERTRALTDASLRLIKDPKRFVLEGDITVRRLSWRREIQEKISFSPRPSPEPKQEPGFFDDLTLNLHLKADDNAWMENSLGRIRGRFDLTVTGDVKAPILLGTIETLGGEVDFQDRKFQILRGRLSFFNPSSVEPFLDVRAETFVKDYRVTITLSGLPSQLKPQFSSSPPLPPEDVLALLAQGEAYKRPYRTETSSQISTASLLSFTLTEGAARRAEKLFRLDRFRIDPFLLGSSAEMTARLTLGKKISKDLFLYYSTNLSRQIEEIIRVEWDVSNEFSIVGTRNEIGRLSLDVKIRRRF